MSVQFLLDKKLNLPIEEHVAPHLIRRFYEQKSINTGKRLRVPSIVPNWAADNTPEQAAWDLIVRLEQGWSSWTETWEVKRDRLYLNTGNFFLEHEAVNHSTADYFLLLTFRDFVITGKTAKELVADPRFPIAYGGEHKKMKGSLIPVPFLRQLTPPI